ncbi:MAG: cupin domain-containing protein [Moorea sp. SIO4G2]|nr:cupin domain-containing protein [Moorena sp. SIO4G2]
MYSQPKSKHYSMKKLSIILPLAILTFGCIVVNSQETSSPNSYTQSVTSEVLGSGYPNQEKKEILQLIRHTIKPRTKLPTHTHTGMQIALVEAGTLTFTVVKGEAKVRKANGTELIMQAGQTTQLTVGDSLVESSGMVHYGENKTNKPVILLSASLFDVDQPKTILLDPEK